MAVQLAPDTQPEGGGQEGAPEALRENSGSSRHAHPALHSHPQGGAWRKQHASDGSERSVRFQNLHKMISCKSSFHFKFDFFFFRLRHDMVLIDAVFY